MIVLDILNALAADSKTTVKEKILRANVNNKDLELCFEYTYNRRINFGMSKVPEECIGTGSPTVSLTKALEFLRSDLSTRAITGNLAKNSLKNLLNCCSPATVEVIDRILCGDLKCGVGSSIANKVWPALIPDVPGQFCSPENDDLIKNIVDKGDAVAEMKADGSRAHTVVSEQDTMSFTRGGNEYTGLQKIKEAILSTNFRNWVIDGEFIYRKKAKASGLSILDDAEDESKVVADRQEGNGILNKSIQGTITKEEADCVIYQVWDIIPRDVYFGERDCPSELTLKKRREFLENFINQCKANGYDNIEALEQHPVTTPEEAKQWYYHYSNRGYEGIILKTLSNVWSNTRTKDFVKFKDKIRVDVEIIGVYPHRKDPSKLGGITIKTADGLMQCNCGSGFKDKSTKKVNGKLVDIPMEERHELDRGLLMQAAPRLIGMIVEVECNGLVTRRGVKDGDAPYKLYLPIIKLFRHDKKSANILTDVFDMSRVLKDKPDSEDKE